MSSEIVGIEWRVLGEGGERVVTTEWSGAGPYKIGRLSSAQLTLQAPSVSRIHAVLECRGGELEIVDLASASGTWVDGARVERAPLRAGSRVRVGAVELVPRWLHARDAIVETLPMGEVEPAESDGQESATAAPSAVEPYTLQGYYDEQGNYIPGYYDDRGRYHLGYGYYDEFRQWIVAHGYYDPQGEWVESATSLPEDRAEGTDLYTAHCFGVSHGETLEIAMLWGENVLAVHQYPEPRTVRVGPAEGNDFVVEHEALTRQDFPLVTCADGACFLALTPPMRGFVQSYGQTWTIESGARARGPAHLGAAARSAADAHRPADLGARRARRGRAAGLVHRARAGDRRRGRHRSQAAAVHRRERGAAPGLLAHGADDAGDGRRIWSWTRRRWTIASSSWRWCPIRTRRICQIWSRGSDGDEPGAERTPGEDGDAGREDAAQTDQSMAREGTDESTQLSGKVSEDRRVVNGSGAAAVLGQAGPALFGGPDEALAGDAIQRHGRDVGRAGWRQPRRGWAGDDRAA